MATVRQDLSSAILSRLLTVSSLRSRVYEYHPGEFTGFPTAAVVSAGHDELIADNERDLRLYNFDVIVYLERGKDGFGTQKAERIRREVEDDIFAVFDNYQTLGGACNWLRINRGGWGTEEGFLFFILNLTVYKQVTIS